ncbi:Calx-beta domain-containing protein [Paludisphaera sp.]|uniref:Calx-beta domain-containing protein n=1 Tax=Paludisphaera sp. TaxID=2017432 RepID=UPI00301C903F
MHSDRLNARRRRPTFDSMEERQLLTSLLLVNNPSVTEGTGGTTAMTFTVTRVGAPDTSVEVDYGTADRTAVAGADYVRTAGTLTFAPGEMAKTVSVPIVTDSIAESNESFQLRLSGAVNSTIVQGIGTGVILDDDVVVAPKLSVADVRMQRGLTGMRGAVFTVSLNAAQRTPVSVLASTANLTAIAGVDYQAKAELLTFAPGETTKTFSVSVYGKTTASADAIFTVNLTGTTVGLARATAFGILRYGA